MFRLISGFCALGLVIGAYFVCPHGLKQKAHQALTPPEETLVQMREGLDALADHLRGPGEVVPPAPAVRAASAAAG